MVAPNSEAVEVQAEKTFEEREALLATLVAEGRRHLNTGNYSGASEKLADAAELSVTLYGEFDAKCYEPHLFYGRALLELGRAEDDVLDNAMRDMPVPNEEDAIDEEQYGNPESLSEDEKNDIKDKVEEALSEEAGDAEKTEEPAEKETTADEPAEKESEEEAAEQPIAEDTEAVAEGENDAAEAEEDGDEELTDAQLAWEVLEVAKKICDGQEQNQEWELKKADVLLELADCSIGSEKYAEAVEDLNTCLALQKKHLPEDDRGIAQTYITMARAFKLNDDFDNAAKFYKQTKETLSARLAAVEADVEKTSEEEAKNKLAGECEDLKAIIADLVLKIDDAEESSKQSEENMNKIREQIGLKTTNVLTETTSAPAGDITNLVRKATKRPAEADTNDAKKIKEDTPSAADASTSAPETPATTTA